MVDLTPPKPVLAYYWLTSGKKPNTSEMLSKHKQFGFQSNIIHRTCTARNFSIVDSFLDHNVYKKGRFYTHPNFIRARQRSGELEIPILVADLLYMFRHLTRDELVGFYIDYKPFNIQLLDAMTDKYIYEMSANDMLDAFNRLKLQSSARGHNIVRGLENATFRVNEDGPHGIRRPTERARARAKHARIVKANNFAKIMAPIIEEIHNDSGDSGKLNCSYISEILNLQGYYTSAGKKWRPEQVRRIVERAAKLGAGGADGASQSEQTAEEVVSRS